MEPHAVEVVVRGHIGPSLRAALEGFRIEPGDAGVSRVTGLVTDQPMLFGLLDMFERLNIEVVSVNPVDDDGAS